MKTHWFIWKGKNSFSDFGLWIRKLPKRTRPKERYQEIEIPGRAGSLILTEGEDVYAAYSDEMTVSCKNNINLDRVTEWLRGQGELILSTDITKAYTVRIANAVVFDREEKDKLFTGTIPLLFQPFRHSVYPERDTVILTGSAGTITNPGDIASRPIVSITGSGNNTVTIGERAVSFTGISGTIKVDCGAQIITAGNQIWDGTFSGELWDIPTGTSAVEQTGNMTISIAPEWRWI